jgi:hypothetical protein
MMKESTSRPYAMADRLWRRSCKMNRMRDWKNGTERRSGRRNWKGKKHRWESRPEGSGYGEAWLRYQDCDMGPRTTVGSQPVRKVALVTFITDVIGYPNLKIRLARVDRGSYTSRRGRAQACGYDVQIQGVSSPSPSYACADVSRWEELEEKPPEGQWAYFGRDQHMPTTQSPPT